VSVERNGVAVLSLGRPGTPQRVPFECDGTPQRYIVRGLDSNGAAGPPFETTVELLQPWLASLLVPTANCGGDRTKVVELELRYRAYFDDRVWWRVANATEGTAIAPGDGSTMIPFSCADERRRYEFKMGTYTWEFTVLRAS
jgi:hypothetical protein